MVKLRSEIFISIVTRNRYNFTSINPNMMIIEIQIVLNLLNNFT